MEQTLSLLAALSVVFSFKFVFSQHLSKALWFDRKLRSHRNA